jgi:hypothetical protein
MLEFCRAVLVQVEKLTEKKDINAKHAFRPQWSRGTHVFYSFFRLAWNGAGDADRK